MPEPDAPRLMTVGEFADLVGLHHLTVYKLIRNNRLKGVTRLGRTIRIDPAKALRGRKYKTA